jgi:hypothetical protein
MEEVMSMELDAWQQFREEFTKLQDEQVEQLQRDVPILAALVTLRGGKEERKHSDFLAYLLNPQAGHGQRGGFLYSFVYSFVPELLHEKIDPEQAEAAIVHREHFGGLIEGQGCRFDILVRFPNGTLLLIENKVVQGDYSEQLQRYCNWLEQRSAAVGRSGQLVYLSPRSERLEGDLADKVKHVSFDDIANWLKAASTWKLPDAIQHAISAYAMSLGSGRLEMSKDMKHFFDDEKNLRTAFEIAEHVNQIREAAIEQFLGHLKDALDKRLSEVGVANTWKVYLNENEDEGSWVTIRKKCGSQRFEACVEIKGTEITYGITDLEGNTRGRRVPQGLEPELDRLGFSGKSNKWSIRERDMREVLGLGDKTLCDVLAVDNIRSEHPLARQIAGELMRLFLACKQFL